METKYAFWSYDLYPFVICAAITDESDEGTYKTTHGWVRPEVIISGAEGLALKNNLEGLTGDYREHQKVVAQVFVEKAAALNTSLRKIKSLSVKLTKETK